MDVKWKWVVAVMSVDLFSLCLLQADDVEKERKGKFGAKFGEMGCPDLMGCPAKFGAKFGDGLP